MWAVTVPPVVFQCRLQKLEFLQWHPSVGRFQLVSPMAFQCGAKFFQWCSSVSCKYSPGRPVVSQWHSTHCDMIMWSAHVIEPLIFIFSYRKSPWIFKSMSRAWCNSIQLDIRSPRDIVICCDDSEMNTDRLKSTPMWLDKRCDLISCRKNWWINQFPI